MIKRNKLYKPAEFAKIVGMTKRALRHYNQLGILTPSFVNASGHKFYSEESFFNAQRILSLRFIGFSLDEIMAIQKSHKDIKDSLKLQHKALEEKANQINVIIQAIDSMQTTLEQSAEIVWENIFNAVKFSKYEMVKEMMMEYYDERAEEYDEIYEGKGPATCSREVYAIDIEGIGKFAESFGTGNLLDIACGSGYWLKLFYNKCSTFTFLDQSEQMLKLCRKKAENFEVIEISSFIKSDILDYSFEETVKFDCALIGFLLGHFTIAQEEIFFKKLKRLLRPGAEILIIDSTWNKGRAKTLHKEDVVERRLNDGRTFKIYKKYFDEEDLPALLNFYGISVKDSFFGETFVAVIGIL